MIYKSFCCEKMMRTTMNINVHKIKHLFSQRKGSRFLMLEIGKEKIDNKKMNPKEWIYLACLVEKNETYILMKENGKRHYLCLYLQVK